MKTAFVLLSAAAMAAVAGIAMAQSTKPTPPRLEDTCSITGQANDIRRIELVRLPNGYFGHRAYAGNGKLVCLSEWSATPALNRQAAEILRDKGNDQATIVDRVPTRQ